MLLGLILIVIEDTYMYIQYMYVHVITIRMYRFIYSIHCTCTVYHDIPAHMQVWESLTGKVVSRWRLSYSSPIVSPILMEGQPSFPPVHLPLRYIHMYMLLNVTLVHATVLYT